MATTAPETSANPLVRITGRIERARGLDAASARLAPLTERLLAGPRRRRALHGHWLGHAVHPMLTDFPLGMWMSATVLDLTGGEGARPAAARLLRLGVLAAVPTAVTGLAEWGATGRVERRVGLVHAAANTVALSLYTAALAARRRSQLAAVGLEVGGGLAAVVGGYFGGHLTEVRKVSSVHPDYEAESAPTQTRAVGVTGPA